MWTEEQEGCHMWLPTCLLWSLQARQFYFTFDFWTIKPLEVSLLEQIEWHEIHKQHLKTHPFYLFGNVVGLFVSGFKKYSEYVNLLFYKVYYIVFWNATACNLVVSTCCCLQGEYGNFAYFLRSVVIYLLDYTVCRHRRLPPGYLLLWEFQTLQGSIDLVT
jgi:hypothetical protein